MLPTLSELSRRLPNFKKECRREMERNKTIYWKTQTKKKGREYRVRDRQNEQQKKKKKKNRS